MGLKEEILADVDQEQLLLELDGLSKTFGTLRANEDVSLSIRPGEIHAILGENGAGKSTLMKMIYGVLAPNSGRILWLGKEVTIQSPASARDLGIGMVFQHFSLFETLTVAENISLSVNETAGALAPRIAEFGDRFGLPVDPLALVHSLSVGQRQRVELIRCLLQSPRLLIMDEPTSVLPPSGIPPLFDTLRKLAKEGCAILFISHKLDEIRSLCQRATIMRAGKVVATVDPTQETNESLARLMIGRELPHPKRVPAKPIDRPAMEIRNLTAVPPDPFGVVLRDVDMILRPGEILGVAGVSGNGQKELASILSGEMTLDSTDGSRILIGGVACGHRSAGHRRSMGLAFVPEERNGRGAVPEMNLVQNTLLTAYPKGLVRNGFIRSAAARAVAEECIARMDVRCQGPDSEARSLSGGNLQKFIVGRELMLKPKIFIAAQPTWGVDVGAAAAIRQELIRLRDEGVALLIVSDELEELLEVADRMQVLFRGRLSPSLSRAEATTTTLGDFMTGGFVRKPAATEETA